MRYVLNPGMLPAIAVPTWVQGVVAMGAEVEAVTAPAMLVAAAVVVVAVINVSAI